MLKLTCWKTNGFSAGYLQRASSKQKQIQLKELHQWALWMMKLVKVLGTLGLENSYFDHHHFQGRTHPQHSSTVSPWPGSCLAKTATAEEKPQISWLWLQKLFFGSGLCILDARKADWTGCCSGNSRVYNWQVLSLFFCDFFMFGFR